MTECISEALSLDKVICPICNRSFKYINNYHLKTHGYSTEVDFLKDYPGTVLRADSVKSHFEVLNQDSEFQRSHAKGGWTEERRHEKSAQMKQVCHDLHYSDEYADARSRMISYGRKHEYKTTDGRVLYLRSFMECKVAKFLELNNIEFRYEEESIPYTCASGRVRRYYPDFYLPQYDIYLEVNLNH